MIQMNIKVLYNKLQFIFISFQFLIGIDVSFSLEFSYQIIFLN